MGKLCKIVIDDKIPFIREVFESFCEVVYIGGGDIRSEDIKDADALIVRTRTKCNRDLLEGSNIKFIATATIGFDHIDSEYCESRNITWVSAPGCNSYSVQQYIGSVLLNIAKNENISLKGKVIGIVGVGNVGSKVAKLAEILGMRVLLNDPPLVAGISGIPSSSLEKERQCKSNKDSLVNLKNIEFVSLSQIQKEADFITFHTPLSRDGDYATYHLVDDDFFGEVRKDLWIINSSRGEVVDNIALKKALKNGTIGGAVLDVWENEPNIDLKLLDLLTYATPHIAGYSADGKANGTAMSVQACSRFFQLGIDSWAPSNVPIPENNKVSIDCKTKDFEQLLRVAILATYDVKNDTNTLKKLPETFEKQRGDYPLRREPLVYNIELINNIANVADKLKELRFIIK